MFGGIHLETWRPFSRDSPWNTPIAADAEVDPDSSAMIADWAGASRYLDIDMGSVPLYAADALTRSYRVRAEVGGSGWPALTGFAAVGDMPIPEGAQPGRSSDRFLLVVDRARMLEWGCANMQRERRGWRAEICASTDLNGTGVRPAASGHASYGARACGVPLVAGLIGIEEIQAGRINHALVVAYPHVRADVFTPPASTPLAADGRGAQAGRGIPCGGRIQYDPGIDVSTLPISNGARTILRALQEYGAYVGDSAESVTLYADASPATQAAWQGETLAAAALHDVALSDFRVLGLGALDVAGK
jgi:hypothetical protein